MTIEERVINLERDLARTKKHNGLLFVVLCLAVAVMISGAAVESKKIEVVATPKVEKEIRAQKIVLVDDEGNMRVSLSAVGDTPGLVLYNEKGMRRGEMSINLFGTTGLYMYNPKGQVNISLSSVKDTAFFVLRNANDTKSVGMSSEPEISLTDKNGNDRIHLQLADIGPSIQLIDEKCNPRITQSTTKDGSGLIMFDDNGKPRIQLGTIKDGPMLLMADEKGAPRASLGISSTKTPDGKTITYPESTLLLFGPDGKETFQAPR